MTTTFTPDDIVYSPVYGRITVAEAAEKAVGNWAEQDNFVWWGRTNYLYPEDWMHYCVETPQSDELESSNAAAIKKILTPYIENGTIVEESHNHWACSPLDMLIVQVYERVLEDGSPLPDDWKPQGSDDLYYYKRERPTSDGTKRGEITEAFLALCEIMDQLHDYPVLDEDDYRERLEVSGVWNVKSALWDLEHEFGDVIDSDNLPENWEYEVYYELQKDGQLEPDHYPSEDEMYDAFMELGWIDPEYLDQDERMEYEVKKLAKKLEDERDSATQLAYWSGMTYEDMARSMLAGVTWPQEGVGG